MQPARNIISQAERSSLELATQVRISDSIRSIGATAWNACYAGELENYDYLLAVENSAMPGFAWCYVTVEEGGDVLAAMPAFFTDYPLDSTLEGTAKKIISLVRHVWPRFLVMKLACLGSPVMECGYAGFHPNVPETRKGELLQRLLQAFEAEAKKRGYGLIGAKDVPLQQKALWDLSAHPLGFRAISSLATATLGIDFASMDEYMNRLSAATRKDMRRKLKASQGVRIDWRSEIGDVLPQVMALYKDTRARGDFAFEELTEAYFTGVLARCGDRAFCTLYYADDRLLAANLMLCDGHRLIDKFFCMDGVEGRRHNLYFLSWFTNLHYCIDHHIKCYQSGQAGYGNKLRLRSTLSPNWLMFRHTNPLWGGLLRLVAPLLAMGDEEEA